jgi:hypothetical protein
MPDTKRPVSFAPEPVIRTSRSGKILGGLGWCVKVMWVDGSIERLYGFASQAAAETWIQELADQWLRGPPGIM